MKIFSIILLSLLLIFLLLYFIMGREGEIVNYPTKNGPIVAFGDSLVEGVGSTRGNDFVSVLSRSVGEPIINLGVAGDTTEDGIVRLSEVIELEPRITILLLGGNDFLRRISRDETFANLESIITRLQSSGSLVVLLGVRGGVLTDGYAREYKALARKTGSVYVENVLDGIFGNAQLMADGIHPNDDGYKIIADKVYREMREVVR